MKRSTFKFLCFEIHISLSYLGALLVGIQKKKRRTVRNEAKIEEKKNTSLVYGSSSLKKP